MKIKTKKYIKRIGIGVALSLMTFGIGIGLAYVQYNNNNYAVAKAVSYDDSNYKIELNTNELNNYTFTNLFDYIQDNYTNFTDTSLTINDIAYTYNRYTDDVLEDDSTYYYLIYQNEDVENIMILNERIMFYDATYESFTYDVIWNLKSSIYSGVKNAIQLDIQANAPSEDDMPQVLSDFVSILVGGISQLATGVANGVSNMAKALFLVVDGNGAVTGLSVFGGIVAIFAGLSLAVAITTKVYQWITSLGN